MVTAPSADARSINGRTFMTKSLEPLCAVTNRPRTRMTVASTGAGVITTNGRTVTVGGVVAVLMEFDAARLKSIARRVDVPRVMTSGLLGSKVRVTV